MTMYWSNKVGIFKCFTLNPYTSQNTKEHKNLSGPYTYERYFVKNGLNKGKWASLQTGISKKKKTKHAKFSEKRTFLSLWYAWRVRIRGLRNARFLENLACFVFFETPVLRFGLLPNYWRKLWTYCIKTRSDQINILTCCKNC